MSIASSDNTAANRRAASSEESTTFSCSDTKNPSAATTCNHARTNPGPPGLTRKIQHALDQQVAWLATQCSKTAVTALMRIAWRTVGAIITRVWADTTTRVDLFAGLRRIGIDEISYKRHHKYLTVVVDHDTGRLVWAAPGRDGTV